MASGSTRTGGASADNRSDSEMSDDFVDDVISGDTSAGTHSSGEDDPLEPDPLRPDPPMPPHHAPPRLPDVIAEPPAALAGSSGDRPADVPPPPEPEVGRGRGPDAMVQSQTGSLWLCLEIISVPLSRHPQSIVLTRSAILGYLGPWP